MAQEEHLEVRPRSTGEILDDGWRLYLGDLPLLLALSGLFLLPAAGVVLWLLFQPEPEGTGRLVLPALAALLLPLTGIGAGSCQEALHCRGEGIAPRLGRCLAATWRRGLNHATAQAFVLLLPGVALLWVGATGMPAVGRWIMAGSFLALFVPVWMVSLCRHPALAAGQRNLWRAWRHSLRASGRHAGRALAVVFSRTVLLLFAAINLHLCARFFLWAAEDLGGFNLALVRVLLSPSNPPYLAALAVFAWWLLAPYAEAVNYLFFIDDRTRYEGLDLWFRVEELFPADRPGAPARGNGKAAPTARAALLAALVCLGTSSAARADAPLDAVRAARQEVAAVRREVERAKPYPGGGRWTEWLRQVGVRLEASARKGGYQWYFRAVESFAELKRDSALKALERVDARLALIEESLARPPEQQGLTPEQIKALVSPDARSRRPKVKPKEDAPRRDEKKNREPPDVKGLQVRNWGGGGALGGGGIALGGVGTILMWALVGLAVAVVVVGAGLLVWHLLRDQQRVRPKEQGAVGPETEEMPEDLGQQSPAALWQQADELARRGDFLGAVRVLYLSVLAVLHQAGLIRYERTRTNGEYADQLRPRLALHAPFCRLTGLFELKWYGERSCREDDFRACRDLAEDLRRTTSPAR